MRPNRYVGAWAVCAVVIAVGAGRRLGLPGSWRTMCRRCRPRPPVPGDHDGWHRGPLASLDFETTGVDPHTDRVISYALLGDGGGESVGTVDPGVPVPPASAAVHGLGDEVLRGAPSSRIAIALVAEWVQSLVERDVGLVVFNAAYDLTMLRAEADRWGIRQPEWHRLLVVDPFVIDWGIERGRRGSRRLVDVAEYYGVSIDTAHDARCDASAARDVAREIGRRHADVGAGTLTSLMQRQRGWHAERVADWNEYARRVGRSLDDPSGWPLSA